MNTRRTRLLQMGSLALFVLLIALVYWPGLRGFWVRDDFFVLAYMRLLDNPWALFANDHFPVPGAIFRPLGFASLWLTQNLFGMEYRAQALADLGLHIAVAAALFRVLSVVLRPPSLALACTLLFAIHPAAIGTVLVWTNRFDVLAALFCLLAVRAAQDYCAGRRPLALAATLLFALAAMASKELGIAVLAPVFLLWLGSALREPREVSWRWTLLSLGAMAIVYFAWRWSVLGTAASNLTGGTPLLDLVGRGIAHWLEYSPGYLSFGPRLRGWQRVALVLAALAFVIAAGFALRRDRSRFWHHRRSELLLSGLALWLSPALLQAPVAALNAAPLAAGISAVEAAMQSRLYYLTSIGATICFAVIVSAIWEASPTKKPFLRATVVALLATALAAFGAAAHRTARDYGRRAEEMGQLAQAALAAVAGRNLSGQSCHVYFLDVRTPNEWDFYASMDAIVKALAPDLNRVQDCLFHNEYPTYFYLVPHGHLDARNAFPFRPLELSGAPVPWLRVDGLDIAYLSPPPRVDRNNAGDGLFFAYEQGRFRDVTPDVLAGSREVHFR